MGTHAVPTSVNTTVQTWQEEGSSAPADLDISPNQQKDTTVKVNNTHVSQWCIKTSYTPTDVFYSIQFVLSFVVLQMWMSVRCMGRVHRTAKTQRAAMSVSVLTAFFLLASPMGLSALLKVKDNALYKPFSLILMIPNLTYNTSLSV